MNVVDVNVLVALARADHPHHASATAWFTASLAEGTPFSAPDFVEAGFVRVVTNRRFWAPMPLDAVFEFLEAFRAQPGYVTWVTSPHTSEIFKQLSLDLGVSGPRSSDLFIAALAAAYGARVVTFDRDFRAFDGVDVTELQRR